MWIQLKTRPPPTAQAGLSLVLASALLVGVWLWCSPAAACSCSHPVGSAHIDWPLEGASDVPTDTSLVVFTIHDERASLTPVLTRVADGLDIPLELERSFVPAICGGADHLLRPTQRLRADETYTLSFRFESSDPSAVPEPLPTRTFTTGTGSLSAAPKVALTFSYRLLSASDACQQDAGMRCDDFAEFGIAFDAKGLKGLPLWISLAQGERVITSPVGYHWVVDPRDEMLAVARGDPCVQVEAIDGYGRSIAKFKTCEPEKCAVLAPDSRVGGGSCTSAGFGGRLWDQIEAGSCAAPPILHIEPQGSKVPFTIEASGNGGSGCSVRGSAASRAPWCTLAIAVGLARRRRGARRAG